MKTYAYRWDSHCARQMPDTMENERVLDGAWSRVDALKRAMRPACPAVDGADYRAHPDPHEVCPRQAVAPGADRGTAGTSGSEDPGGDTPRLT